jgi:hypothetical protein
MEVAVVAMIMVAALFGSATVSERAFRLLRWAAGRAEPPPHVRSKPEKRL